jgi:outer membrane protein assembly factor BamA
MSASVRAQEEGDSAKYQPPRDYGHLWKVGSLFAITPEDGVLLGSGPVLYEYGFRTFPYVYRMELVGGLTLKTGRFKFVYTAQMPSLTKHLGLDIRVQASELEVRNFYDYGNVSFRDEEKDDDLIYRVTSREYFLQPALHYRIDAHFFIGLQANIKHFDLRRSDSPRHIDTVASQVLGDRRTITGAGLIFGVDYRDRVVATRSGGYLTVEWWEYPDPFKQRLPFDKWRGDLRLYVSPVKDDLTFAVRVGGEKVSGAFPFYEAAFLGGGKSLRGYSLQRFGGDASAFGSAEVRFYLARLKILVPSDVGLFVLGDAGRVWVNNKSPGGWHSDAGGGIWIAPIRRELTLSVAVAKSVDGVFVNGGFGFGF